MKMSPAHYAELKEAIFKTIDEGVVNSGKSFSEIRTQFRHDGLSEMRFRWDIFWASKFNGTPTYRSEAFKEYHDTHIDTALKKIILEYEVQRMVQNPASGMPIEFRLYTYDVWGNEQDGYDVNDVSRTSEIYKLFKGYTDKEILVELQEQGAIPKAGIDLRLIKIEGDFDSSLAFYYNGRPEFELRAED